VLSIQVTSAGKNETYAYTYAAALQAAVPFVLQGAYANGMIINGGITPGDWGNPISVDFYFGPNGGGSITPDPDPDPDKPDPDPDPDAPLTEIPKQGTMYNGNLIAAVSNKASKSADLILYSAHEWTELLSKDANAAIQYYKENDWTDWRVPTKAEAEKIQSYYMMPTNMTNANKLLIAAGQPPLSNAEDVRYLCNFTLHTYRFEIGAPIAVAGAKRTYNLRAVRTVHVKLE
jgi:hypothetical protein